MLTNLGKISVPTLLTAQVKKLLATAASLAFRNIEKDQLKNITPKSTKKIASMPQVDSLISPVVAHGVNTISAPFRPDIDQLKMSQVQPVVINENNSKIRFADILNPAFHTSSSSEGVAVHSRCSLPAFRRLCWTHGGLCCPKRRRVFLYFQKHAKISSVHVVYNL